jgi:hypothetical protein
MEVSSKEQRAFYPILEVKELEVGEASATEEKILAIVKAVNKKTVGFRRGCLQVKYYPNEAGIDLTTLDTTYVNFEKKGKPKCIADDYTKKSIPTHLLPEEFNKFNQFFNEEFTNAIKNSQNVKRIDFSEGGKFIKQALRQTYVSKEKYDYKPVFAFDPELNSHVLILTFSSKRAITLSYNRENETTTLKESNSNNLKLYKNQEGSFLFLRGPVVERKLVSDVLAEYGLNPKKRRPSLPYLVRYCRFTEQEVQRYKTASLSRELKEIVRNRNILEANSKLLTLRKNKKISAGPKPRG